MYIYLPRSYFSYSAWPLIRWCGNVFAASSRFRLFFSWSQQNYKVRCHECIFVVVEFRLLLIFKRLLIASQHLWWFAWFKKSNLKCLKKFHLLLFEIHCFLKVCRHYYLIFKSLRSGLCLLWIEKVNMY